MGTTSEASAPAPDHGHPRGKRVVDGIVEALDGRFHDSSVASDEVTGAIIAIEGPKSPQLSDATAIVGGVQKRLTDKVEIIWGLNFTDEDVLRATVLLAIQQK